MTDSANDSWEEIENRYEYSGGATAILVQLERFEKVGGDPHSKMVEDPAEGNVWVVVVTHLSHHWITTRFEGRHTAWEFADLLTHLFSELGYMMAKATTVCQRGLR